MASKTSIRQVSLDLHDFSLLNNRWDLLYKIKEHQPGFKVSLFTIPFDARQELGLQKIYRQQAVEELKKNLDWVQIIPHGLAHVPKEMLNCDYQTFKEGVIPSIAEVFGKDDIPYIKGFCAPYWLWNEDVVRALDEEGWWGAIDKNQPGMLKTKRTYTYSHSIEEPYWMSNSKVLKLHGHIDGISLNDLERCITGFTKLKDVEWHFVTDFIDDGKKD